MVTKVVVLVGISVVEILGCWATPEIQNATNGRYIVHRTLRTLWYGTRGQQ